MKKVLIMITTTLFLCLFVFFASKTLVFADEVGEETITESSEASTSSESTEPTETSDETKIFNITQEDIDKIIEAAKQGNIDEVKNLLIGTIGFTSFTILMALIYLVKAKIKQANESKLLESANESTNDNIRALAKQLNEVTALVNSKMDNVETSVKNYYQALNSEKVEEATKKAEEIAKALEAAMNLNKTSDEGTQEESTEEIETE